MTTAASSPRSETGLLLLADISGYTAFLGLVADAHPDMTEVAPAYPVLSGMLDTVVHSIAPTFRLAEIEGDAVFAHAAEGSLANGADELLAIVRGAHAAYRARIEEAMVVHYHPCTACTILPTLDLKFLLHHGSFVVQQVAGQEKLLGPAVNLVHRLLKNAVTRETGKRAYLFVTDAAATYLDLAPELGLAHEERYPDVGPVPGIVFDVATGADGPRVPTPPAG
jgi:hypothetical protein